MQSDGVSVIVTGGCGHIGSYIVEHLAKTLRNSTIVSLDNLYNGKLSNIAHAKKIATERNNTVINQEVSVSDQNTMYRIFKQYRPQYVFHYASMLTLDSKKDRLRAMRVNIYGMGIVLEMCKLHNVEKLVYASSASVYGTPNTFPTTEQHDFNNCKLLYGATKVADEFLARSYADEEGIKFVGLRFFNVYGERQSSSNVYTQIVPKWIKLIKEGKPITIYGDGNQTMDMIHGDDVGRLSVKAMEDDGLYRNSFFDGFINICSGVETSVADLYKIMVNTLDKCGVENNSEVVYEDHDPNLVSRRQGDNTLMLKNLGECVISVEEGIERTIRALL